jgi:hypothetical protein
MSECTVKPLVTWEGAKVPETRKSNVIPLLRPHQRSQESTAVEWAVGDDPERQARMTGVASGFGDLAEPVSPRCLAA